MSNYGRLKAALARSAPTTLYLDLTRQCPLNCQHCYNETHRALPDELKVDEWRDVIRQAADMSAASVQMTGGEVFTRHDFLDLVEYARNLDLAVKVGTSGYLLAGNAQALHDLSPLAVFVTIYGSNNEIHDSVTRVEGSFNRTLAGISELLGTGTTVELRCPVLTLNLSDVPNIVQLADRLGVRLNLFGAILPRLNGDAFPTSLAVSQAEYQRLISDVRIGSCFPKATYVESTTDVVPMEDIAASEVWVYPNGDIAGSLGGAIAGNVRSASLSALCSAEIVKATQQEVIGLVQARRKEYVDLLSSP